MGKEHGDMWREYARERKEAKWRRYEQSLELLSQANYSFVVLSKQTAHVFVEGCVDFWPTTGRWSIRKRSIRSRGIANLLGFLDKEKGNGKTVAG